MRPKQLFHLKTDTFNIAQTKSLTWNVCPKLKPFKVDIYDQLQTGQVCNGHNLWNFRDVSAVYLGNTRYIATFNGTGFVYFWVYTLLYSFNRKDQYTSYGNSCSCGHNVYRDISSLTDTH